MCNMRAAAIATLLLMAGLAGVGFPGCGPKALPPSRTPSDQAGTVAYPLLSLESIRDAGSGKPGFMTVFDKSRTEVTTASELPAEMPRHVILYVIDALRADRLEFRGHRPNGVPEITGCMPFLEELSKKAAVFTRCFSYTTWTLPSVRSILSGQRADTDVSVSRPGALPAGAELLPGILQRAGWLTGFISESPFVGTPYGLAKGFDMGAQYTGRYQRDRSAFRAAMSGMTLLSEFAFLERYPGLATFLYVHTLETHEPYIVPPQFRVEKPQDGSAAAAKTAGYDNGARFADHNLSLLVAMLEERGLFEDTLLIVTADHGEALHPEESEDGMGHGGALCLTKVHVPLVVCWPRRIPDGRRIEENVQVLDIAPTILDLLGYPIPASYEGDSLRPLLFGGDAGAFKERTILLAGSHGGRVSGKDTSEDSIGIVRGEWVFLRLGNRERVYRTLGADVSPAYSAQENPEQTAQMSEELGHFIEQHPLPVSAQTKAVKEEPPMTDETHRENLKALGYL